MTTYNFKIKRVKQEDLATFKPLVHLFNTVFEEDESNIGSDEHLSNLLGNDHFIAFVAVHEEEVVGGLTAYELPLYCASQSEIFLYDLAVQTEHQQKGIGKRLIRKLKEYCAENHIHEFFVLAHEEDEHAVEFYRATGGRSEKVVNFVYSQL